eukprot:796739-Rhodomonas_salina.1
MQAHLVQTPHSTSARDAIPETDTASGLLPWLRTPRRPCGGVATPPPRSPNYRPTRCCGKPEADVRRNAPRRFESWRGL